MQRPHGGVERVCTACSTLAALVRPDIKPCSLVSATRHVDFSIFCANIQVVCIFCVCPPMCISFSLSPLKLSLSQRFTMLLHAVNKRKLKLMQSTRPVHAAQESLIEKVRERRKKRCISLTLTMCPDEFIKKELKNDKPIM